VDPLGEVVLRLLQTFQNGPDLVELGLAGELFDVDPFDGVVAAQASPGGLHVVERGAVHDVGAVLADQHLGMFGIDTGFRADLHRIVDQLSNAALQRVQGAVADMLERHPPGCDGDESAQGLNGRHRPERLACARTRLREHPAFALVQHVDLPFVAGQRRAASHDLGSAPGRFVLQMIEQALVVRVNGAEAVPQ